MKFLWKTASKSNYNYKNNEIEEQVEDEKSNRN